MKERWKTVRTGTLIVVFTILGVLEYAALMQCFDLPQVMLVAPLIGAAAMICLGKKCFFVPACTVVFSCLYQILVGSSNAVARLQTNAVSIMMILFECLLVLLVFEFVGIGGGALLRLIWKGNRKITIRIITGILGVLVTVGPYLAVYHNPLYPLMAQIQLRQYADEHLTDYQIGYKRVYYSLQNLDYVCRISMADGKIRIIGYDSEGKIVEQE